MLSPQTHQVLPKATHGVGLMPPNISFPKISLPQRPPLADFPMESKPNQWRCL